MCKTLCWGHISGYSECGLHSHEAYHSSRGDSWKQWANKRSLLKRPAEGWWSLLMKGRRKFNGKLLGVSRSRPCDGRGWCDKTLEKWGRRTWRPSWVMKCDVPAEKCSYWWALINWTYLCHQHIDFKNLSISTTGKHCLGAAGNYSSLPLLLPCVKGPVGFQDLLWGNFWFSQAVCCCCSLFLTIQGLMLPGAHGYLLWGFIIMPGLYPTLTMNIHGIICIW